MEGEFAKMGLNHICFFVEDYPTADDPSYTFVGQLIHSIADFGLTCSVIAPQSITKSLVRKKRLRSTLWVDRSKNNSAIYIYQPMYFSFSNLKVLNLNLSYILWRSAVIKTYNSIQIKPDILYGHFWHCGIVAAIIAEDVKLPVFIASGEDRIIVRDLYSEKEITKYLSNIGGVICVSSKNMQESIDLKLVSKEKMALIPNAIESTKFYPINKIDARKKLGFKNDDFIVAFMGHFTHRKGVMRVSQAVQKVHNAKSIFIGSGNQKPDAEGILFVGRLPHDEVMYYLNAADVFVLPTLAEGCSNAIIEAMACGLPIVSSDLSFNDDILDKDNSIRIDSNSINQIAGAIAYLRDNPKVRHRMSKASLGKAQKFDINIRARNIIEFIRGNGEL